MYYQITYELGEDHSEDGYLHAQWRRSNPLAWQVPHTILDGIEGPGHYVGTYLAWGVNSNGWWGEGEIKFFLDDDEDYPTICGTGTEDYFGGAWNFDVPGQGYTEFSTPYLGHAAGDPARRALRRPAALRHVPLAHARPDPLQQPAQGRHPGARLAQRAAATCRCRTTSPPRPSSTWTARPPVGRSRRRPTAWRSTPGWGRGPADPNATSDSG